MQKADIVRNTAGREPGFAKRTDQDLTSESLLQQGCDGLWREWPVQAQPSRCGSANQNRNRQPTEGPRAPSLHGAVQTILRTASRTTSQITRKTKKRIFAIPMAAPAIPVNPSMPAMIAMTRKMSDQCNMRFAGAITEPTALTMRAQGLCHPCDKRPSCIDAKRRGVL